MIYSCYRNDEVNKLFSIRFSNVEEAITDFKTVNATYHLENAINKAFSARERPDKFDIAISDQGNYYLKLIAIAFVAFIRGLGYSDDSISTNI